MIARELNGGQEQNYRITLSQKQHASIIVEQRGIDVVIQLLGTDGNLILTTDDEYRTNGQEKIEIVAETDQSYQLRIKSSSNGVPQDSTKFEFRKFGHLLKMIGCFMKPHKLDAEFSKGSSGWKLC